MTDQPKMEQVHLTGPMLRDLVAEAYANMGELAISMKGMAYLSGIIDVTDELRTLTELVRTAALEGSQFLPPPTKLDVATLAYVVEHATHCVTLAAKTVTIMQQALTDPTTEEGPAPGSKPN